MEEGHCGSCLNSKALFSFIWMYFFNEIFDINCIEINYVFQITVLSSLIIMGKSYTVLKTSNTNISKVTFPNMAISISQIKYFIFILKVYLYLLNFLVIIIRMYLLLVSTCTRHLTHGPKLRLKALSPQIINQILHIDSTDWN